MDTEPLLAANSSSPTSTLLPSHYSSPNEITINIPSESNLITSSSLPNLHYQGSSSSSSPSSSLHGTLHRSKTAPALATVSDLRLLQPQLQSNLQKLKPEFSSISLIKQSLCLLIVYLSLGVLIYSLNRENYSGVRTHPVVDAIYFCIITMCTIGYGDITPLTPATKVFSCVFVLVGFGFIDILLCGVMNYILDLQENMILTSIQVGDKVNRERGFSAKKYFFDSEKGRMRIRMKVGLALGVVIMCIGTGIMVLCFVEELNWVDSVYLSVMSVTTVGYGDRAFSTLLGRLFASFWLLFSTLAVGRAFLYLAEARIDKRRRLIIKSALQRDITIQDLLAADTNNNGFISKSDYVIYKLKEMKKINEKDIVEICSQFNKLDPSNTGRITLPDLLENRGRTK